ncbi:Oidioi.mRNA.OKI2018_I69.chr2.g4530.t1.cds [Oikopleura dioica]|uniref:Oidioi.mRNA.OKI2018_I69.chr2.g4530.t1.cds n=1 Tax=Oikopleura dioica TaxID=34765 RepID=A0ABN7T1G8_OIKDI|nr:Oidioi.mRNA.OKI2018_I69.chr2.g4530.t1.cds [Oikopleura dioica]
MRFICIQGFALVAAVRSPLRLNEEPSISDIISNYLLTSSSKSQNSDGYILIRTSRNNHEGCRLEKDRYTENQIVEDLLCGNAVAKMWLERKVCPGKRDCFKCDSSSIRIPLAENGLDLNTCISPVINKFDRMASKYLCHDNTQAHSWGLCSGPQQLMNSPRCPNFLLSDLFDHRAKHLVLYECCKTEVHELERPIRCYPSQYRTINMNL